MVCILFINSLNYYNLIFIHITELYKDEERFGRGFTAQELYNVENGITTDWLDLVTQDAVQQNHTISVSGFCKHHYLYQSNQNAVRIKYLE